MANKVLTGVKKIFFTPWKKQGEDLVVDTANRLELKSIVGDSVAISQDDPETTTIECETSDSPLYEVTKLGKYTITMDSADISPEILSTCMGFEIIGSDLASAAPSSYKEKYVVVEVIMDTAAFVMPKVLINSKLDASTLKTNIAKGTLSGSALEANVKIGSEDAVLTPFVVVNAGDSSSYATPVIEDK